MRPSSSSRTSVGSGPACIFSAHSATSTGGSVRIQRPSSATAAMISPHAVASLGGRPAGPASPEPKEVGSSPAGGLARRAFPMTGPAGAVVSGSFGPRGLSLAAALLALAGRRSVGLVLLGLAGRDRGRVVGDRCCGIVLLGLAGAASIRPLGLGLAGGDEAAVVLLGLAPAGRRPGLAACRPGPAGTPPASPGRGGGLSRAAPRRNRPTSLASRPAAVAMGSAARGLGPAGGVGPGRLRAGETPVAADGRVRGRGRDRGSASAVGGRGRVDEGRRYKASRPGGGRP